MAKRSFRQIEESLRKKLAEADPLNPLGDIGRTSPHRGDPIMSPELGGGQGPGGAGGGGARVWRVPGKPTSQTSPRIDKEIAANKAREKELGPVKDPVDAAARIIAQQRAAAGQPPREPSADKPSVGPQPQTPQEKLIAQAQQRARETGEPTVAITDPKASKILDRLFPEPKAKVEPTLRPPSKEAERQEKLQQLRQREAERQQQKQADQQPQPAAPTANAPKTSTRTDSEIVDKPTFTSPRAWYKKLATEKGVDAAEKYRTYYTGSTGNEKLPSWGSRAGTAGKYGAYGLGAAGLYQLVKPDEQKPDQEKPADQPPAATDQPPPPVAPDKTAPVAPKPDARTQSALPQDDDSAKQGTEPPAIEPVQPPPLQPYPPGTKFPKDEILQRQDRFRTSAFAEAYSKVLHKYQNFLYEETEQEKRYRETREKLQRGIYGQESRSGKARTDKPNYAGALGPMQIMPKTFQWMKDTKIIPKDFDIKNPEQNREAGNALIAHYYDKYQGDPAKVAAAYYAGPKAVNKDGTINTHWRDRKNPKAPDVGKYINQTLSRAGLDDVTYMAAQPRVKPDVSVAAAPVITAPAPDTTIPAEPKVQPQIDTQVAKAAAFDPKKFDYDAFYRAVDRGEDWTDFSRFMKTSSVGDKPSVSERYEQFKATTR